MTTKTPNVLTIILIALVLAVCIMVLGSVFNLNQEESVNLEPYKKELRVLNNKIQNKKGSKDYDYLNEEIQTAAFLVGEISNGGIKEEKEVKKNIENIENIIKRLNKKLE